MGLQDIFISPVLIPFIKEKKNNGGIMGIHIVYKLSHDKNIKECVYLASSIKELRNKIRELHRVQVTLGQQINIPIEKADKQNQFLVYKPITGKFSIEGKSVINSDTGMKLPIRMNRWIKHKKKDMFF